MQAQAAAAVNTATVANTAVKMGFLERLKDMFMRLLKYVSKGKNWRSSPKLWIGALIVLRIILVFCREYGLTLGKKSMKGEHVFLTGAGSGIGRLMAQKLGKMGAKLSISDINFEGVQ